MASALTPDQRADRLAAKQRGLLNHLQARGCGLSDDQIGNRVDTGRWVRVARGLYRVAGAPVTVEQAALAPCLIGPPRTATSFVTAAALHGWADAPLLPHVTVPRGMSARLRIATVHRADLDPIDLTRRYGIPITSPARTLVDCSSAVTRVQLTKMVDDAFTAKVVTVDGIEAAIARSGRGRPRLAEALRAWSPTIQPESAGEVRLLRLLKEWGFEPPVCQFVLRDERGIIVARLDVAWPHRKGALEYDGERWHGPRRWGSDEHRHDRAETLGWWIRHVDKYDLGAGRDRLRRDLEKLLAPRVALIRPSAG